MIKIKPVENLQRQKITGRGYELVESFKHFFPNSKKKKKVTVIDNLTNYSGTLAEINSIVTMFHGES